MGCLLDLFSRLADHLPRQEENYLTQVLAALLDGSAAFRGQFRALLVQRGALSPRAPVLRVWTQERRSREDGYSILDLLLCDDRGVDHLAVEVKFAAQVSYPQLRAHLKSVRPACRLVLLTTLADVPMPKGLAQRVTALSWAEVVRCAYEALENCRSQAERWLLEEFMSFLEMKGIAAPDPVALANWARIIRLVSMVRDHERTDSGNLSETLPALSTVAARLDAHRDEAWGELRDLGWHAFGKLWRSKGDQGIDRISVISGFYRRPTNRALKREVYNYNFGLELILYSADRRSRPPVLKIWWYRHQKVRGKFAADRRRKEYRELPTGYSNKVVKNLFAKEWDTAHKQLSPWMKRGLAQFKVSALGREAVAQ
jgi:hypothetical protein